MGIFSSREQENRDLRAELKQYKERLAGLRADEILPNKGIAGVDSLQVQADPVSLLCYLKSLPANERTELCGADVTPDMTCVLNNIKPIINHYNKNRKDTERPYVHACPPSDIIKIVYGNPYQNVARVVLISYLKNIKLENVTDQTTTGDLFIQAKNNDYRLMYFRLTGDLKRINFATTLEIMQKYYEDVHNSNDLIKELYKTYLDSETGGMTVFPFDKPLDAAIQKAFESEFVEPAPEPQPEEQPNQTQAAFRQRSLYQNTKLKNVLGEVPNILQSGFSFHQKSNSLQDALESTPNIFQQRLRRRY